MGALTVQYVLMAIIAGLILLVVVPGAIQAYRRFRGKRIVTCPETMRPVAVDVDAALAALSTTVGDEHPTLRLNDCTRWPERKDCGQECLAQIEQGPENCLVRAIVAKWYEGKTCVLCGRSFAEIHWYEHKPALRSPDGETVQWKDVPPEKLPEVLSTHQPVCWNCHIAETFRHRYPELVTDRDFGPSMSR